MVLTDWPDSLPITPIVSPFDVTIDDLPGSKSITNRALLLAALAQGSSTLTGVLFSDDSRVMMDCLVGLGVAMDIDQAAERVTVTGCGGRWPVRQADLFVGNSGTTIRFLTAACAAAADFDASDHGNRGDLLSLTFDGIARMCQRPIKPLVDALISAGATVDYLGQAGYPPIRIGSGVKRNPTIKLDPSISSQYVSALLMAGPVMGGVTLEFEATVVSRPYVEMTLAMLEDRGVRCDVDASWRRIRVPCGESAMQPDESDVPGGESGAIRALSQVIEPDASNASYFFAAAAVVPGSRCCVRHLGGRSLQGDARFAQRVLARMGCEVATTDQAITVVGPGDGTGLTGIDIDLNDMPDMAQTLTVVALFAKGATVIRNVGNLRVKETDRLSALQAELSKLGATVTIDGDDLHIVPPADGKLRSAKIATYDDHRMAMAFAVAGLASSGVVIDEPGCVAKTFPGYFEYLGRLLPG